MKKILLAIITGLVVATGLQGGLVHAGAFSGSKDAVCAGVALKEGQTCAQVTAGSRDPSDIVKIALNIFSVIIGIIAVVMMMIGGVKYMTSQGDPSQTNSAKNTILYAAIGIVVAALSQVIVRFVLTRFT